MNGVMVLVAGALVGVGVITLAAGLRPGVPELHAAMSRLTVSALGMSADDVPAPTARARARERVLPQLVESLGLRRYAADAAMVGERLDALAARKVVYGLVGLVFPLVLTSLVALVGAAPPPAVPVAASIALAAVLFFLPDVDLRRRATAARDALRQATCVYLELVALERAADAGTTEALDRAASVAGTREFARLRDALLRAELAGLPSWDGLTDLAERTGVTELGDLADIMRLSGHDGAAVYATLRARATSLRTQLLAASTAKANAASEHMVVPTALLGVAFMALIAYPALARIMFG